MDPGQAGSDLVLVQASVRVKTVFLHQSRRQIDVSVFNLTNTRRNVTTDLNMKTFLLFLILDLDLDSV